MRRSLLAAALCTSATSAVRLEARGVTHNVLRSQTVFSTRGDRVALSELLPAPDSEERCVVALLRHFG